MWSKRPACHKGKCRHEPLKTWWKDRFLLAVESNLILYGYDGEQFFTRRFDSREEFGRIRATLGERLPTPGFYARDSGLEYD